MSSALEALIDSLRQELQQYGEMLALLDEEQDLVVRRTPSDLLRCVARIQFQAGAIQAARRQREQCHAGFARAVGLPERAECTSLLARLPENYRPLLQALVRENNELLLRVHQRSRQNHLLLTRSVELMQGLISTLLPAAESPTYNETGAMLEPVLPTRALYDAVG